MTRRARETSILDCLAAGYRFDLDDASYLQNLVETAAESLDRGLGVVAYTYDARDPSNPVIGPMATSERFDPAWLAAWYGAVQAAALEARPDTQPTGFALWSGLTCAQVSAVPKLRVLIPHFVHFGGARDVFALNALDASGHGLWLGAPWPTAKKEPAGRLMLFERLAAHLTSAIRLRRTAAAGAERVDAAVFSPEGALLHAEKDALEAHRDLRRAAIALEYRRSKQGRSDAVETTRRWRPLVASKWSLLDDFQSDSRRFVVAVENPPPTRDPGHDLSERERQVLTHAHLGHSNKVIAYELGLSASTVRVFLHRAAQKLGASTRVEAIARFDAFVRRRGERRREEP